MIRLSPKTALILFIVLVAFVIAQATWWVVFMAQLVDEKVELAEQLTSDPVVIQRIHEEEIDRQVMIGLEGLVFLLVLGGGLWIIYYAYTRQQELNRRQENFLMATTHELKTPLSSIRVYLDALQSDRIPEDRKAEVVPRIREDVQRLQNLVDKTLQAGRIGRQSLSKERRETFDFSGLVQERLNALLELPNSKRLELTRDITPSLMVSGERASLATAIDQVLENALKYTRQETIELHVKVEATDDWVRLRIADNGIGLSKKDLERIFDRFERVGSELTRDFDGTGLGLYLCREIVHSHGGRIKAHSEGPDTGTTFEITLKRLN